jgi:hypothetical protein
VTTTDSERVASLVGGFSTGVTTLPTGQGFKRTFYKRKLPSPPSTAFSSAAGLYMLDASRDTPCLMMGAPCLRPVLLVTLAW